MDGAANTLTPDLAQTLERQRAAFLRDGPPPFTSRRNDLKRLKQTLLANREAFAVAISSDFGYRSRKESLLFEIATVANGVDFLRRNLADWLQPRRRHVSLSFKPASNTVRYQPLGVIGVIAPWNYPVALAMMPLATAIAAGNRVMLKPSELTPKTSGLIRTVLAGVFHEDQVAVVLGDASVGAAFSALNFDHLLFTGSTSVGRSVMRAASETLTPVTLELGGKSPVIVQPGASLAMAARRIVYGKLANAGQTCIAPDYVLIRESDRQAFADACIAETGRLYPGILGNPDYSAIVNDRHYDRLVALREDARTKGARIVDMTLTPGAPAHPRKFAPALILDPTADMKVMQEEIFGPLLPVMTYRDVGEAIAHVNAGQRPLALYCFGPDGPDRRRILANTTSGGVAINETNLHYGQDDLPFGGVGESGMGAYHGMEGVRTMSHARAVFTQSGLTGADLVRPPFGRAFDRVLAYLLR